jgi:glutamate--cysteine ligase
VSDAPITEIAALAADVERRLFTPARASGARRIGAEVEMLPIDLDTHRIASIDPDAEVSTLRLLRAHGAAEGWIERVSPYGVSSFGVPGLGVLSFEPGGQLEYSSAPAPGATALLEELRRVLLPLRASARESGIELVFEGMDPWNPLQDAPLQLFTERYCRMADYFARLGAPGGRMMRQTASFQVCLDLGDAPFARWRLLNAAAPYVSAAFANSPFYAGHVTGRPSQRAHTWRNVDASRTGLPYDDGAPVAAYLEFALCAPDFLHPTPDGDQLPFVGRVGRGLATEVEWRAHLTTLFPEVRPRGFFEVRSADAIEPEQWAAPLALLAGIAYDERAADDAGALLGSPDLACLRIAADRGLAEPRVAAAARDLFAIALEGCARLGPDFIAPGDLAEARTFAERYTARGRSPADDRIEAALRRAS